MTTATVLHSQDQYFEAHPYDEFAGHMIHVVLRVCTLIQVKC